MNEFGTRKRLATLVGTLALGASLAAGPALADRGERGFGGPFRRALSMLDLTQDQKDAIHKKVDAHRPALQSLRDQIRENGHALRDAASQKNADPTAVGTLFLKVRANREALKAERERTRADVESVLTDKQKAKLEGFRAARPAFRGRFRGAPMGEPAPN